MAEIKKILIANRGEIVQRAIRTIREMGKKSVAVYSAGDKNASYLKHADEAVCIGGAKSSESYLNIPAIITAAEMTGCDAIFPGYGFLSENQDFVEICRLHNIKFIGPSVEVMEKMADKSKAKEEMIRAGVPVVPGSKGAVHSVAEGRKVALEIGYPIMAKAAAGGGGRPRLFHDPRATARAGHASAAGAAPRRRPRPGHPGSPSGSHRLLMRICRSE
jgi:acetyl-CoA carboxylase biotin carboxylase subunit